MGIVSVKQAMASINYWAVHEIERSTYILHYNPPLIRLHVNHSAMTLYSAACTVMVSAWLMVLATTRISLTGAARSNGGKQTLTASAMKRQYWKSIILI